VENRYDRVAPIYDRLAALVFGERLLVAQAQHLHRLPPECKIVIAGGGSGGILDLIAGLAEPPQTIYYIDSSPRMIALAKRRLALSGYDAFARSVHFTEMSVNRWQPPEPIDALLTPYLLDCFDGASLERMLDHLSQWLRPDGMWLVTDFTESRHTVQRMIMATMFAFFRITASLQSKRLENYGAKIARLGFTSLDRLCFNTIAGPVISEIFQKPLPDPSIAVAKAPANLEA